MLKFTKLKLNIFSGPIKLILRILNTKLCHSLYQNVKRLLTMFHRRKTTFGIISVKLRRWPRWNINKTGFLGKFWTNLFSATFRHKNIMTIKSKCKWAVEKWLALHIFEIWTICALTGQMITFFNLFSHKVYCIYYYYFRKNLMA
jgi:hypothetical protein